MDILIYAGVCREQYEPATACAVAANLGISPDATMYDLSNACLGVLNGWSKSPTGSSWASAGPGWW